MLHGYRSISEVLDSVNKSRQFRIQFTDRANGCKNSFLAVNQADATQHSQISTKKTVIFA